LHLDLTLPFLERLTKVQVKKKKNGIKYQKNLQTHVSVDYIKNINLRTSSKNIFTFQQRDLKFTFYLQ